ncbi:MAG: DEAD/DEAH box helicase family protein [Clostridiales bacterium]|nr:DEAD/DEAH box helicase family protein [Clostridiales bacterium]
MELKTYQKNVIKDLKRYLELLNDTTDLSLAFRRFWEEKGVPVTSGGIQPYQNILPGVPNLCLKVPTGGGKTFLACNAIRPIFDALPTTKIKAVVWLVPSDSILTQTLAALRNPEHDYRQKINADFGSRVEIYTKEQLLNGQNFNITSVSEQLSIMVLSYDSFRGRKEALKARQENGNLAQIAKALGTPTHPVEGADETALLQIINQLSPLVIVDESHHARSKLSREMLENFNPCFVLDLTATPTKESNILCYVDALQLKKENMVKLPVIVYNRSSQREVMADAVDLRKQLEKQANEEYLEQEAAKPGNGVYIRPIVLFQAQPKGKEDSTTFEKLREKLVEAGIPAEEIAIKTADVNELKNIDLLSPDCPIRYIITVNALKEGWDCPFAYILASLANKTSQIDVEQIVGRVLRQPYTRRHGKAPLNMSYVLTSSYDFKTTLDGIVKGLNGAGFSGKDYRIGSDIQKPIPSPEYIQQNLLRDPLYYGEDPVLNSIPAARKEPEEFLEFDAASLAKELTDRQENQDESSLSDGVAAMLEDAFREQAAMDDAFSSEPENGFADIPAEVQDKMTHFYMNTEFTEEIGKIQIPQFFLKVEDSFFIDGYTVKLEKEHLAEGFTLKGKPYPTQFDHTDSEMVRVDLGDKEGSTPRVFKMSETDQRYIKAQFSRFSTEQKIRTCKDIIHKNLNQINMIDGYELRQYVDLIVDQMDSDTLSALEKSPLGFSARIRNYVEALLETHYEKCFTEWLETGKIVCEPSYQLPPVISPIHSTNIFGGSLYQAEEEVNGFEYEMVMALTSLSNIRWWHRNISKRGLCLNGFINHYPDFIVMTKKGRIILIETKGDHLENTETKQKLSLGRAWQNHTADMYRYYMVFQSKDLKLDGAYQIDKFIDILAQL